MDKNGKIIRPRSDWSSLFFYQKAQSLYLLTFEFVQRFIQNNDRTKDQMLQAARSGKQNIVEGTADGVTSLEMELNLLNVSRASIQELKEDYLDYLCTRRLSIWDRNNPRYLPMLQYCRLHNQPTDYIALFPKFNDEELSNLAITLSHQIDSLMQAYMNKIINTLSQTRNSYPRFGG
ncbi:MAG: four helix bundle protein [Victivallales bacterium]|nr:four helix bundle protein [Victivallales bacterium]